MRVLILEIGACQGEGGVGLNVTHRGPTGGARPTMEKAFNKIKSTERLWKMKEEWTMISLRKLLEEPREAKV